MKYKFTLLIIIVSLIDLPLFAQDAYKWTDKSGRVIYGNKAPKSNSKVTGISTRGLSKYNSDKVLKRMGGVPPVKVSKDVATKDINKDISGASETVLETLEVEALQDESGAYTSVKVKVVNPGEKDALDVSVAFKFNDGQLVPAEGPFEISSKGEAEYKIPEELLPVEVKPSQSKEPPKAIVHGFSL